MRTCGALDDVSVCSFGTPMIVDEISIFTGYTDDSFDLELVTVDNELMPLVRRCTVRDLLLARIPMIAVLRVARARMKQSAALISSGRFQTPSLLTMDASLMMSMSRVVCA